VGRPLTADDLAAPFDAFDRHDIDAAMAHFADDCVSCTVAGPEVHGTRIEGAAAIAEAFSGVWAGMSDAHRDHHGHLVHDDRAVTERAFSGTSADGQRIEAQGADLFTRRGGKIAVKQAICKQRIT